MANIEFEENDNDFHIRSRALFGAPTTPTMISYLLKKGIVKTQKQAVFILFGTAVILLLVSYIVAFGSNSSKAEYVNLPSGGKITIEEYVDGLKSGKYQP